MKGSNWLWLAVLCLPLVAHAATIKEGVDYKGWKCVVMQNDTTEVIVAPEIGGRIIQYRVDGHDWFWVNEALAGKVYPPEENDVMEKWKNYGGDKVWPAPQGWSRTDQWPGPGDAVIVAPYKYEILQADGKEVSLKLIGSDKGGYAGVQFSRVLTLRDGSNKLEMTHTMRNVTKDLQRWGIWEVAQMDFSDRGVKKGDKDWNEDAYLAIPLNKNSRWPEKYKVMFGEASSFNWQPDYKKGIMYIRYMNMVGKMTMDVAAGWGAMVDPTVGQSFVMRFPFQPGVVYPDGGNWESWVAGKGEFVHKNRLNVAADDPKGRLIEMEVLGPKVELAPGQQTSLKVSWEVVKGNEEDIIKQAAKKAPAKKTAKKK